MLFKLKQTFQNPYYSTIILVSMVLLAAGLFFYTENFLFAALIVVPLVLFALLADYRIILYMLVFFLPLSTTFRIGEINLNIAMPSEPFIGLLAVIALIFIFIQDKRSGVLRHPVTILLFVYWASLVVSLIFSTMPSVSFKTLLVASAYLLVFYFLIAYYFLYNDHKVKNIFAAYALSFTAIVIYITWKHSDHAFNKNVSAVVVDPFFSDHTIYGACLAFMVPIVGILYFQARVFNLNYFQKLLAGFSLLCFLVGIYLSHSRATWISLACMIALLLILRMKIKFSTLMIVMGIVLVVALLNLEALMPVLIKNKYDSKAKRANLEEQIKSVTNIKNDVSNAERVNRWLCAARMFKEKPVTGFGPGTYQFKYIPFQKGSEMTPISITSAKNNFNKGMGGTAHSEYLLALAESGLVAGIVLLAMALYSIYLGMKLYYKEQGPYKYYALMMLLSLFTYFIHGIFNNFLTTDKAAFLVWGGLATLCALDLRYKKNNSTKNTNSLQA
ncbi:MAG TPA: O-antigen ligase family protein [Cytophagaceae bacterium]|nr:O-antigen ligase family protein [Cytophagaceae bacterium]